MTADSPRRPLVLSAAVLTALAAGAFGLSRLAPSAVALASAEAGQADPITPDTDGFVTLADLRNPQAVVDFLTPRFMEAPELAALTEDQRTKLADRVGRMLSALSADSPDEHLALMESWGGHFEGGVVVTPDGRSWSPLNEWTASDSPRAFALLRLGQLSLAARVNEHHADGYGRLCHARGLGLYSVSPLCFTGTHTGLPGLQDEAASTTAQVCIESMNNAAESYRFVQSMRWVEALNNWIPGPRDFRFENSVQFPKYFY